VNKTSCACICRCRFGGPADDCDGLCEGCWREWGQGSADHGPVADASYLGTYGIGGVWTGWLLSVGASHIVAEHPGFISRYVVPPKCPDPHCRAAMVARPGAWKCYRHPEAIVKPMEIAFPKSPRLKVLS